MEKRLYIKPSILVELIEEDVITNSGDNLVPFSDNNHSWAGPTV